MAPPNVCFSFPPFDYNGAYDDDDDDAIEDVEREDQRVVKGKQIETNSPLLDFQVFSPFFPDFGTCHQNPPNQTSSEVVSKVHPQTFHENRKPQNSLDLLTNYWTSMVKKTKPWKPPEKARDEFKAPHGKLSTLEIIQVAGTRYVQFPDQSENHFSILMHPFGSAFSGLCEEDTKEIELVQFLLAATEKVGDQQFDRASRLLSYCELLASKGASPAQRVVLYFAEALRDRIDMETGRVDLKGGGTEWSKRDESHDVKQGLGRSLASLTCHKQTPFTQVTQFVAIQSIMEHTSTARRIHIIDLEILSGIQWIVLMEALAERARNNNDNRDETVELLRITAVVSNLEFQNQVEETGSRLAKVADSMNLPFSFKLVLAPGMEGVLGDTFGTEHGETVVVYASLVLRTMIARPNRLEGLMRAVKGTHPALMLVTEVEANHNSPSFMTRFIEALFFCSAYIDCLDECMGEGRDRHYRRAIEGMLREGIRNMAGKEGEERVARSVKVEVWRAFFRRFGMAEVGLSESSLYQASLVAKSKQQFERSCSLEASGKALLVGWKGTPILSLSAWKFSQ
ncbi:hypothetical protein CRG98_031456 [Punica granatum]|uniref:Uncharacterized protein n=1 Tax=Punica granatum TaxID=22663 RepID=A0A2I0IW04_PUNGR|nr:hypothetical protein CRG98_031456 [Punica granatum]